MVIAISTLFQAVIQIDRYSGVWGGDFRFWSSVLTFLSLGSIFTVQWLEHSRLRNPNGVVLFYWLFILIAFSVKLRSLISQQVYDQHRLYFIAYCVGFGLSWIEFGLEWLVPKEKGAYNALVDDEECPIEYATVFSILTFSWMTPMMRYGEWSFPRQRIMSPRRWKKFKSWDGSMLHLVASSTIAGHADFETPQATRNT